MHTSSALSHKDPAQSGVPPLTHLQRLVAESIHIKREVIEECERTIML
jgi:hypothetical protein